jgi:hypothetical protein
MKKHRQEPNQKQELYGGANETLAKIKASHKQQKKKRKKIKASHRQQKLKLYTNSKT